MHTCATEGLFPAHLDFVTPCSLAAPTGVLRGASWAQVSSAASNIGGSSVFLVGAMAPTSSNKDQSPKPPKPKAAASSGGQPHGAKAKAKSKAKAKASAMDVGCSGSSSTTLIKCDPKVHPCGGQFDATTTAAAKRCISRKLGHIDQDVIQQARDSHGRSVLYAVCVECARASKEDRYIKNDWWLQLLDDFGLACKAWEQLPQPPESKAYIEIIDTEIGEIVAQAIGDNLVSRAPGIVRLEKKLETVDRLPLFQVHSLLMCSQESHAVKRKASLKMQMAILSFMARTGIPQLWPEGWTVVQRRLEHVFLQFWRPDAQTWLGYCVREAVSLGYWCLFFYVSMCESLWRNARERWNVL